MEKRELSEGFGRLGCPMLCAGWKPPPPPKQNPKQLTLRNYNWCCKSEQLLWNNCCRKMGLIFLQINHEHMLKPTARQILYSLCFSFHFLQHKKVWNHWRFSSFLCIREPVFCLHPWKLRRRWKGNRTGETLLWHNESEQYCWTLESHLEKQPQFARYKPQIAHNQK